MIATNRYYSRSEGQCLVQFVTAMSLELRDGDLRTDKGNLIGGRTTVRISPSIRFLPRCKVKALDLTNWLGFQVVGEGFAHQGFVI